MQVQFGNCATFSVILPCHGLGLNWEEAHKRHGGKTGSVGMERLVICGD